MSRQLTKKLRKIVYYYGYRSVRSWPSQLQGFHKMQNTFKIEILASRFIWKGGYWPKNRSQTKVTDNQSKTFPRCQLVLHELKFHQSIKISNCNMAAIIDFCRECLFNKKVPFFEICPPEKNFGAPGIVCMFYNVYRFLLLPFLSAFIVFLLCFDLCCCG